jgi:hypothetical protein
MPSGKNANKEALRKMGCGCEATITKDDPRAEIWMYVFGKLSFPLKHPIPKNMGPIVGTGLEGDAKALTEEQKERLIEAMTKKFGIKREDVTKVLDIGIVPIRAENVIVSWCALHSRALI